MKKKVEVTQIVCDLCEEDADGSFDLDMTANNEFVQGYHCPIDLCELHMEMFKDMVRSRLEDYFPTCDGYDDVSNDTKQRMIKELKDYR
jgi:hypothetical protein